MSGSVFLQHLSNSLALGSLYALIAIGYTMVYGLLRLINFAHANIFTAGAYFAFVFVSLLNFSWVISYILAIIFTAILGLLTDRIAYRPLREAPRISVLISAIAVSFFLENLYVIVFGGRPKSFPRPRFMENIILFGQVRVPAVNVAIIATFIILFVILTFFIYRTKQGMAMRALSSDFNTARLMAMDVNKIIAIVFIIGSSLAAVGGILWANKYPSIHPYMSAMPGIKAFIAAIVGGIGNVVGAAIGGLILGLIEILLVAFVPELSGYKDAIAFLLLILILFWKPTGILGSKARTKV